MAVDSNCNDEKEDHVMNDWSKMKNTAKNAGYREGRSIGRESVFQEGFDAGYQQGFKNGFDLGIYHGISRIKSCPNSSKKANEESVELLNKPTTANCQICLNNDLLNDSIQEIHSTHDKHHQEIKSQLHLKYGNTAKLLKIDNLN